ncbi:MAG: single-stranded DNA-binding protein [Clostridia bacterium]|nr:single-stranded DNA-binding protein [Clostridia bacterium]
MNKVILIGRLTRDPELSTINSGVSVCRFSIAVDRPYTKDGERIADFINIVAWRSQADFVAKYFRKGSPCALTGSLQVRTYDAQDGTKRTASEVVADSIEFVPRSTATTESGEQQAAPKKVSDLTPIEDDDDDMPF